jgi:hypothetical protein
MSPKSSAFMTFEFYQIQKYCGLKICLLQFSQSKADPLDIIERHLIATPVVQLRGARVRVPSHALRGVKRSVVDEVRGDAGAAHAV